MSDTDFHADKSRLDSAAERLCDVAERVLDHAHESVWGREWDWSEHDPIRDTARGVECFRRWQQTGESGHTYLRPGLQPQAAWGDQVLSGLGSLLREWDDFDVGDELSPGLEDEAVTAMRRYWEIRQEEGGPGFANPKQWNR